MRILIEGSLRGERFQVFWTDGLLSGSPEILRRLAHSQTGAVRIETASQAIVTLEQLTGQQLSFRVVRDEPSSRVESSRRDVG